MNVRDEVGELDAFSNTHTHTHIYIHLVLFLPISVSVSKPNRCARNSNSDLAHLAGVEGILDRQLCWSYRRRRSNELDMVRLARFGSS